MKNLPTRRTFIAAALLTGLAFPLLAPAQDFPTKSIKIIVPLSAGGTGDTLARTVADGHLARTGPGRRSSRTSPAPAAWSAPRSPPHAPADGYTLVAVSPSHVINPVIHASKKTYDPIKGFEPITVMANTHQMIVAHPSVPREEPEGTHRLREEEPRQAQLRLGGHWARPRTSTWSSSSPWPASRSCTCRTRARRRRARTCSPARCSSRSTACCPCSRCIKDGRLIAMGLTSSKRAQSNPEIPTIGEVVQGYASDTWYGLLAPAGTPKDVIAKLHAAAAKALNAAGGEGALPQARRRDRRQHAGGVPQAPRGRAEDLGQGDQGLRRDDQVRKRATTQLRELIARGPTLYVPGCYNAMSAQVLEQAGFEAIYMTGYGTSLSLTGLPDVGLATMSEMVANARYIAAAVRIPLLADADTGFGNAINVIRTVREYIGAGVAGIHMEDQVSPKRCGHVAGRLVIPLEEAVGKIRAAVDTRNGLDPDFVIVARTDARGASGGSLDEAIARVNAYLEAGADLAFIEGPTSVEEVQRICREVKGPVFYNMTGVSPRFTLDEMRAMGIAMCISPNAMLRSALAAMHDLAAQMNAEGPVAETRFMEGFAKHPLGDLHTFAGFDQVRAWEREYLGEEAMKKYADSVGHVPK